MAKKLDVLSIGRQKRKKVKALLNEQGPLYRQVVAAAGDRDVIVVVVKVTRKRGFGLGINRTVRAVGTEVRKGAKSARKAVR